MKVPYLKNFLHYFKGETLIKIFNILALPIFTYLLDPSDYGNMVVFMSLYGILIIILPLNIFQSIQPRYLKQKENFNDFLSSVLFGGTIVMFFSILLILIFSENIVNFFNLNFKILYFAVVASFFRFYFEIYSKLILAFNIGKKYSNIHILWNGSELLVTTIFFILLSNNVYLGKAYSIILIAVLFSVFSLKKIQTFCSLRFYFQHLKESLTFSFPLILHSVSIMALAQFDRLIINQLFSSTETGIYSIAYSIGLVASIINTPLINAGLPSIFENISKNNINNLVLYIEKITKYVVAFSLLVIFFSKEGMLILTPTKYHESINLISIVAFSSSILIAYQFYSQYIFFNGKTFNIALVTAFSAVLNIGLNYLLLPIFGYKFAAIITLASNIFLVISMFLISKYYFSNSTPSLNVFFKPFSIILLGLGLVQLDFYFNINVFISFICRGIIFVIIIYLQFKNELKLLNRLKIKS
ncbi:MAG: oligosaccharide flippase family protein [Bacteroidetes bacterium]|nr:oligosaccharide flippase family protein [Bacteroidota bacterium]